MMDTRHIYLTQCPREVILHVRIPILELDTADQPPPKYFALPVIHTTRNGLARYANPGSTA
jgi:hypothetical protein